MFPLVLPLAAGVSLALLYLWLLATNRTGFRLRSSREVARHLRSSRRALAGLGALLAAGAVATIVGERFLRAAVAAAADGRSGNAYSRSAAVVAPALMVVGALNLLTVAAGAGAPGRRFLAWAAVAANAALAAVMYRFGLSLDFDSGHGNRLFSTSDEFPKRWVLFSSSSDGDVAFPPQPLTAYHFLRAAPAHLCTFLPLIAVVLLLRSLCWVSLLEQDEGRKTMEIKRKRTKKTSYFICLLGLVAILTSLILVEGLCRLRVVTSVSYGNFSSTSAILVGLLTATGVIAVCQAGSSSKKTGKAARLTLLVLSVLTFVWAYQCLDYSDGVEVAARRVRTLLSAGPAKPGCKENGEGEEKDVHGDKAVVHVYVNNFFDRHNGTEEEEQHRLRRRRRRATSSPSEVCFSVRTTGASCPGEGDPVTVVCVEEDRVCDGVADVAAAAHTCYAAVDAESGGAVSFGRDNSDDDGYGYYESRPTCGPAVAFPDETDCPRSVRPPLGAARGAAWAAMAVAMVMMAASAFGDCGGDDDGEDSDGDSSSSSSSGMSGWASAVREKLGGRTKRSSDLSDVPC